MYDACVCMKHMFTHPIALSSTASSAIQIQILLTEDSIPRLYLVYGTFLPHFLGHGPIVYPSPLCNIQIH